MKSIVKSTSSGEVLASTTGTPSVETLDNALWPRLDLAARDIAVDMLAKQPARDRLHPRFSAGDGAAFAIGRRILDALDTEVERRKADRFGPQRKRWTPIVRSSVCSSPRTRASRHARNTRR